ncbi:MAG: hypothetical protein S4CHLAM45_05470 [Chlamydiales bacterium]|nr:hypothetical protein [Chlamydiales bacterium]MCH9619912.1 hypothetical protein [Chlamydiales bacterium]MCH9622661.1 hypothetical protein [Chlamydiales bacterium]
MVQEMDHLVDKIVRRFDLTKGEESPPLSVILPTYNCAEKVGTTLESIANQGYKALEVIVIDGGSTDHTLNIVNQYTPLVNRVYTVATSHVPEMLNRGIALATSRYLTFIYPGSTYLSKCTYDTFAKQVVKSNFPDIVYAGTVQRELFKEPIQINHPLSQRGLQKGILPTRMLACWYRADFFDVVGGINLNYSLHFALDYFCRIAQIKEKRVERIDRILVDFDSGTFTYRKGLTYACETWSILSSNYGFKTAFRWLISLNHLELIRFSLRYLKHQIFE